MRNKSGNILMIVGLLLLVAALSITIYNIYDENRAEQSAQKLLEDWPDEVEDTPDIPDYVLDPEMEMPKKLIDGVSCIGTIQIEALDLYLPVISEWSYPNLRIAPCRYEGSAYQDNLVIAAHNYRRHFGSIKQLRRGDHVVFTDIVGNTFHYEVQDIEILQPTMVEEMVTGDWDLTLFTCTVGGRTRLAIRCMKTEE